MTAYRLFPGTDGPTTPVDFGAGVEFVSATGFWLTQNTMYFEGYWWWVCGSQTIDRPADASVCGRTRAMPTKRASTGRSSRNSVVTSGTLLAGQWN